MLENLLRTALLRGMGVNSYTHQVIFTRAMQASQEPGISHLTVTGKVAFDKSRKKVASVPPPPAPQSQCL